MPVRYFGYATDAELEKNLLPCGVELQDLFGPEPTKLGMRCLESFGDDKKRRLFRLARYKGLEDISDSLRLQAKRYRHNLRTYGEFAPDNPLAWNRYGGLYHCARTMRRNAWKEHQRTQEQVVTDLVGPA